MAARQTMWIPGLIGIVLEELLAEIAETEVARSP